MNLISMLLLFFCIIGFDRIYNGILPKPPLSLDEQVNKTYVSEQLPIIPPSINNDPRLARVEHHKKSQVH